MMRKSWISAAAVAAVMMVSTPVLAADKAETASAAGVASASSAALPKKQKATKYCFNTEATGSRLSKRVCLTEAEWANEGVNVADVTKSKP